MSTQGSVEGGKGAVDAVDSRAEEESDLQDHTHKLLNRGVLKVAGFRKEHLKKAYETTVAGLEADKEQWFYLPSTKTMELLKTKDMKLRLDAADKLFKLVGAYPSEDENRGGGAMVVEVQVLSAQGDGTVVRLGVK